jgi:hypothetical protein
MPGPVSGLRRHGHTSPGDGGTIAGVVGPGYAATSVTSFAVATGSKAFTTQAGLAYTAGARVRVSSAAAPTTNYMEGVVTAYSGTTLTVTVDLVGGSGTHTDWNINLAGQQGLTGTGTPADVVPHGNLGSTETFDYALGAQADHSGTLNAACTFTFTNAAVSGKLTLLTLHLAVDSGGPYAVTLPASVSNKTAAEAFLAAVPANTTAIVPFVSIDAGTSYLAVLVGDGSLDLDAILALSGGQDIADALTGAASPNAGNVYATMADTGGGGSAALLGLKVYPPLGGSSVATDYPVSSQATLIDVDATNLAVTFTAPASGNVLVRLTAYCYVNATGARLDWGVREGSTNVAPRALAVTSSTVEVCVSRAFLITGLSAGSHTFKWAFSCTSASGGSIRVSDTAGDYGQGAMEVWAAP